MARNTKKETRKKTVEEALELAAAAQELGLTVEKLKHDRMILERSFAFLMMLNRENKSELFEAEAKELIRLHQVSRSLNESLLTPYLGQSTDHHKKNNLIHQLCARRFLPLLKHVLNHPDAQADLKKALNQLNSKKLTPLWILLKDDERSDEVYDLVKLMIEKGADPKVRDANGCSLLQNATIRLDGPLIQYWVDHGLDMKESLPGLGWSHLFQLVKAFGQKDIETQSRELSDFILLFNHCIDLGADIHHRCQWGENLGNLLAQMHGKPAAKILQELIVQGMTVNHVSSQNSTLLHIAARAGHSAEFARTLLECGVPWETINQQGNRAIDYITYSNPSNGNQRRDSWIATYEQFQLDGITKHTLSQRSSDAKKSGRTIRL